MFIAQLVNSWLLTCEWTCVIYYMTIYYILLDCPWVNSSKIWHLHTYNDSNYKLSTIKAQPQLSFFLLVTSLPFVLSLPIYLCISQTVEYIVVATFKKSPLVGVYCLLSVSIRSPTLFIHFQQSIFTFSRQNIVHSLHSHATGRFKTFNLNPFL